MNTIIENKNNILSTTKCDGCKNNCLLSEAKCAKGIKKAEEITNVNAPAVRRRKRICKKHRGL